MSPSSRSKTTAPADEIKGPATTQALLCHLRKYNDTRGRSTLDTISAEPLLSQLLEDLSRFRNGKLLLKGNYDKRAQLSFDVVRNQRSWNSRTGTGLLKKNP